MKKTPSYATMLAFLGAAAILLTGCGQKVAERVVEKGIETAIEKNAAKNGEKIDVDLDKGKMTIKGSNEEGSYELKAEEGSTSVNGEEEIQEGDAAKIPDDFPKDIPLYEGMKVNRVTHERGTSGFSIAASVPDPVGKVADFFKKEVEAKGWVEEMNMTQNADQMHMLQYSMGDRELTLMLMKQDSGTEIHLTTLKKAGAGT